MSQMSKFQYDMIWHIIFHRILGKESSVIHHIGCTFFPSLEHCGDSAISTPSNGTRVSENDSWTTIWTNDNCFQNQGDH